MVGDAELGGGYQNFIGDEGGGGGGSRSACGFGRGVQIRRGPKSAVTPGLFGARNHIALLASYGKEYFKVYQENQPFIF